MAKLYNAFIQEIRDLRRTFFFLQQKNVYVCLQSITKRIFLEERKKSLRQPNNGWDYNDDWRLELRSNRVFWERSIDFILIENFQKNKQINLDDVMLQWFSEEKKTKLLILKCYWLIFNAQDIWFASCSIQNHIVIITLHSPNQQKKNSNGCRLSRKRRILAREVHFYSSLCHHFWSTLHRKHLMTLITIVIWWLN